MKNSQESVLQERFDSLMIPGIQRIVWAREHIVKFEGALWGEGNGIEAMPAEFLNDRKENVYPTLIQHLLYTAIRAAEAAIAVLGHPLGASPVEQLLRGTLLASAKALYLLSPVDRDERESRTEAVYKSDRYQYDLAIWTQEVLEDPSAPRPKGKLVSETQVIRTTLDYLVERGNCQCGAPDCPQYDLEGLRSRIMGWWNLYSAVVHANTWHLEVASVPSPSGEARTTGELSQACYDIGWLHAQAVVHCLERFGLAHLIEPLILGEI